MSYRSRSTIAHSSGSVEGLYQGLILCLQHSLAASTLATYRSGARQYINFCNFHRFSPFPVAEMVCFFAGHFVQSEFLYHVRQNQS